jgi:hypothetical protein
MPLTILPVRRLHHHDLADHQASRGDAADQDTVTRPQRGLHAHLFNGNDHRAQPKPHKHRGCTKNDAYQYHEQSGHLRTPALVASRRRSDR